MDGFDRFVWRMDPTAPAERPGYECQLAELRAALAEPELDQGWVSGRILILDQVVELALQRTDHRP